MKDLLFLPIDIDLSELNFQQLDNTNKSDKWQGWWDATWISDDTVKKTGFDKILNQLPFTKITRLFHKIQTRPVGSHLDCAPDMNYDEGEYDYLKSIEPGGYRLVLKGRTDTLFVFDNKEWRRAVMPGTPGCYILNATRGYHKVADDPNREMIWLRGYVDYDKHQEILKRSFEKYKDYAIYFQ